VAEVGPGGRDWSPGPHVTKHEAQVKLLGKAHPRLTQGSPKRFAQAHAAQDSITLGLGQGQPRADFNILGGKKEQNLVRAHLSLPIREMSEGES
jgi:hypothetical protein